MAGKVPEETNSITINPYEHNSHTGKETAVVR